MIDPKALQQNLEITAEQLATRGFVLDTKAYQTLEEQRKRVQVDTQTLQNQRNQMSKDIGMRKRDGKPTDDLMAEAENIGKTLLSVEQENDHILKAQEQILLYIPNLPDASTPIGKSEADNIVVKTVGKPPVFEFKPLDHLALAETCSGFDIDSATRMSGARFNIMKGAIAKLHRVLGQFMLDTHLQHGYTEVNVPLMVTDETLRGTGQLPKLEEDLFFVRHTRPMYLIPTAEVPLTSLVADQIVDGAKLPLRFVAHTPCFRSEAGSYGKDTRGMFRQHQFEKVELVCVSHPDHSMAMLETMLQDASRILDLLELPYRVVSLCTGDMGFASSKTYDLEVYLPGQGAYREISSVSNVKDFQARRMMARFREDSQSKPRLVHTLNGSGLAVGRTLIAVMECYQQADGSIRVPKVLQERMGCAVIK